MPRREELVASPRRLRWTAALYGALTGRYPWAEAARLETLQWRSPAELEPLVLTRLRAVVAHAERSVPYYRDLFARSGVRSGELAVVADLARFPISTKAELRREPLARRKAADLAPHRLRRRWTGGSTGTPFEFWLDAGSAEYGLATYLLFRRWAGAGSRDGRLQVASPVHFQERPSALERALRPLLVGDRVRFVRGADLSLDVFLEEVESLARHGPWFLWTYPSYATSLGQQLLERGARLPAPPTTVVCYAEALTELDRAILARAFEAPVSDLYSSSEITLLALSCPDHPEYLHVNPLRAIVRVVREDGSDAGPDEVGRVVVTDLGNFVSPFVNYELEDLAQVGGLCPCGRGFPTLRALVGRAAEALRTPAGRVVSAAMLSGAVSLACRGDSEVREFQAALLAPDRLELRVVPGEQWSAATAARLTAALAEAVGSGMGVEVKPVAALTRSASEKRRLLVDEQVAESGGR